MPFLAAIDDYNANLAFVRIRMKSGRDVAGTIVVNRWHDNVAYLFGEDGRARRRRRTAPTSSRA